jgi:hypothetical protein
MSDIRPHHHQHRDRFLARLRARLSYANVTATLALFLALTGTATAAIVLPRDSVGAEQIQTDAVRSPEIAADAVRGSEILDESVALDDLTPGARASLDAPRVRVDDGGPYSAFLSRCFDVLDCSNLLAIHLPAGRWLVQAKLALDGTISSADRCGLIQSDTTIIDEAPGIGPHRVIGSDYVNSSEQLGLMAVLTTAPGIDSTTVAVRCERYAEIGSVSWDGGKLTAIEVKSEAQEN